MFKETTVFSTPKNCLPRDDKPESRERVRKYYVKKLDEIEEMLKENPNQNIVLDRFFVSELVYGKVIRWYNSNDMEEYQEKIIAKLKDIQEKYWYAIIYLSDKTEAIRNRYLEKGDDYIKDKKYYHNLKVEYGKKMNALEKVFKVMSINVFEQEDYWQHLIEEIFLSDYEYTRNGKH